MVVYRSGSKGDYGYIQVWTQRRLWVYTGLDPKGTMGIYRFGHKGDYGCIQVCIQRRLQVIYKFVHKADYG